MSHIVQIPVQEHSQNVCLRIALWLESVEDITRQLGVTFEVLEDEFLPLKAALIKDLETGSIYGFRRYLKCTTPGVEILINEHTKEPTRELDRLVKLLNLAESQLERCL